MNRICVSALALAALAGAASAQPSIQFRMVERTGQLIATTGDPIIEIAVQARVTGGFMLGGVNFNITTNDAEANGTFLKAKINTGGIPNPYNTGTWLTGNTVGVHGIAGQYSYLASINSQFNGLINASGGTFTQNPAVNDIGLIAGAATQTSLLSAPGIDTNGDGNPDTAPSDIDFGDMTGNPQNNEVAQVTDPAIRGPYFADGQFIDVYRFRYTVANINIGRTIHFDLSDVGAQSFQELLYNNGAWGAENSTAGANQITVTGYDVITPTPASVALMGLGGLMVARRRRS